MFFSIPCIIVALMRENDQRKTPYVDALKKYIEEDVSPFDVPGHHMGNITNAATKLLGHETYRCDVNAPLGLDNLSLPTGVIKEAEDLLAKATHSDRAFFSVNGTSGAIIAMILTAVKAGEKIILPRNVHKSIINAIILSGAVPVYVMPEIDQDLEIANQPSIETWKKAILKHPGAKAVFVINPTYFGSVGPLKEIVEFAHSHNMAVLVDEAHGAHYYFHIDGQPLSAMDAGADMSAASFHKTVGSLTQSSVLLMHTNLFQPEDVQTSLNIITTTSPSALLMASLDAARATMASKKGKREMEETYQLANYARKEINKIPGFINEDRVHFLSHGSFDYDESKLVIGLDKLDLDGYSLYKLLKEKYDIQMELAETYTLLGILAIGTKKKHIDHLINALKEISKEHYRPNITYPDCHFDNSFPFMLVRPRVAFHAPGILNKIEDCVGLISKEQVMMYPPGIPLIVPGEVWTKELVNRVLYFQKQQAKGGHLLSAYKDGFLVIDNNKWKRFPFYKKRLEDYQKSKKTIPSNDGYYLPFEGDKHEATLILMPYRKDTWRNDAKEATENYLEVIKAIAEHEEVKVGIYPSLYRKLAPRLQTIPNVTTLSIRYNDAWARDNMPLFLSDGKRLRTLDFRFNAWGGKVDGLYSNFKDDDRLGQVISKRLHLLSYYHPSFVLEGGSIATDGEGTLLVTEACLLSKGRNPSLTKEEIEETLKEYLNVTKVIWLPHGIYEDETNEHVDNMVAFVKGGEVVMAWTKNKNDPQYPFCQATYQALSKARDAKGRKFIIHKLPLPNPPLYLKKEETKGLRISKTTLDKRVENRRLAASYVNFYLGKDFLVMPAFGVKEDKEAKEILTTLFPDRKIHQIMSREILLGGGNIHCITMQIPEVKHEN